LVAAVYARRSTDQNVAEDTKSVTRQIDNARAFAESQGWAVDERYIFSDDGVSGAETRKLVEKRMLDLIKNGAPFEVPVMQAQARFSRRDGDEAFTELKSIARSGVEAWFYADGRVVRRESDSKGGGRHVSESGNRYFDDPGRCPAHSTGPQRRPVSWNTDIVKGCTTSIWGNQKLSGLKARTRLKSVRRDEAF